MSMETNGMHTETSSDTIGNVVTNYTIKAVSKPGVSSWRGITTGNCYTNGMNYDRSKESHLMKNSEWGAVAYLTHSKYGRNGTEVDINNNGETFYTGGGAGDAYKTNVGQSSTNNVTGIYDLNGNAWEYIATFDTLAKDSHNYFPYGSSFAGKNVVSTKYATAYKNGTEIYNGKPTVDEVNKIGDGIKEVYVMDDYLWFNDLMTFVYSTAPFLARGGRYDGNSSSGIFSSSAHHGGKDINISFRVVLTG